jgi:hypothetical protein
MLLAGQWLRTMFLMRKPSIYGNGAVGIHNLACVLMVEVSALVANAPVGFADQHFRSTAVVGPTLLGLELALPARQGVLCGPIFKRIVNTESTNYPFAVDSLYAAYLLQEEANKYEFGWGTSKPSRRQTRYLFYLTVMELLRDVFIQEGIKATQGALTRAVIQLSEPGNEAAFRKLLNRAVSVIDRYLMSVNYNSVYKEPEFTGHFTSNLNSFLKWEQLGKYEEMMPRFHRLLTGAKIVLSDPDDHGRSPAERIMVAVKGSHRR